VGVTGTGIQTLVNIDAGDPRSDKSVYALARERAKSVDTVTGSGVAVVQFVHSTLININACLPGTRKSSSTNTSKGAEGVETIGMRVTVMLAHFALVHVGARDAIPTKAQSARAGKRPNTVVARCFRATIVGRNALVHIDTGVTVSRKAGQACTIVTAFGVQTDCIHVTMVVSRGTLIQITACQAIARVAGIASALV